MGPTRRQVLRWAAGAVPTWSTSRAWAATPGPRLETKYGAVYVYAPPGLRPRQARVVVYVHGLFDDVDSAWKKHDLAAQFHASGRNAVFIVPDAPSAAEQPVVWPSLAGLLVAVRRALPRGLPAAARITAVGHSAGYRTIAAWLDHPRLDEIILVDGLYGSEDAYARWLRRPGHRMVMTVLTTKKWAGPFVRRFRGALKLPRIPDAHAIPAQARTARLVTMPSQYGHMELVTEGRALPALLRMSRATGR